MLYDAQLQDGPVFTLLGVFITVFGAQVSPNARSSAHSPARYVEFLSFCNSLARLLIAANLSDWKVRVRDMYPGKTSRNHFLYSTQRGKSKGCSLILFLTSSSSSGEAYPCYSIRICSNPQKSFISITFSLKLDTSFSLCPFPQLDLQNLPTSILRYRIHKLHSTNQLFVPSQHLPHILVHFSLCQATPVLQY